jgi:hypothetical protein
MIGAMVFDGTYAVKSSSRRSSALVTAAAFEEGESAAWAFKGKVLRLG